MIKSRGSSSKRLCVAGTFLGVLLNIIFIRFFIEQATIKTNVSDEEIIAQVTGE